MTEGDRGSPSKPILGEGIRSTCPYVLIWLKGTGAVPQNPSWVKVFEYMSICPNMTQGDQDAIPQNPSWVKVFECMSIYLNMTERDRGRPSKPILGEGTRVYVYVPLWPKWYRGSPSKPILGEDTQMHVHMSQYDRRGPGQALKTHPGWRYSSSGPYVPIWPKGTGTVPQNPSWVKVLECMSICPNMTEGDRGRPSKPILGEGTRVQVHMSHIWLKGTGAVPQNPSWVKVLEYMSICPIMTKGDRGSPSKPILGEGTRVQVHMSQCDQRGPGQALKTHLGWRYSSTGPYVPLWPKETGAVPENPSWVKVLAVHVHMSQYDWRGPGQVLKTHLGWRHSSAGPYVPVWPKGTGADPQNPSWVEVLECRSTCLNMSQGGQRGGCIPLEGEAFIIPSK